MRRPLLTVTHFVKPPDHFVKSIDHFVKRPDYFVKSIDHFVKRPDYSRTNGATPERIVNRLD